MKITFDPIRKEDNKEIALIIRRVLEEHGADYAGTVYNDASLWTMWENYQIDKAEYWIARIDGEIVGGGGLAPLIGLEKDHCELQRLFLLSEARGYQIGKSIIELSLQYAEEEGYQYCYLETLSIMKQAIRLYEYLGFKQQEFRLGNTGHHACGIQMLRKNKLL